MNNQDEMITKVKNLIYKNLNDFNSKRNDDFDFIYSWDDYDWCYECGGYGDDYSFDKDGNLISNCDDCPNNPDNKH